MRQIFCFSALVVFSLNAVPASAAVFQYTAPVVTDRGERTAFLWIPPDADQVRGVVMGGMTLMEREFAKDERIRHACAQEKLAIVFLKCGLGSVDPHQVLDDLARVSGYRELSAAPLMLPTRISGCRTRCTGRPRTATSCARD